MIYIYKILAVLALAAIVVGSIYILDLLFTR
jgi:preprotein translocase subunit SecE